MVVYFTGSVPNVTVCVTDLWLQQWEERQIPVLTLKYKRYLQNRKIPYLLTSGSATEHDPKPHPSASLLSISSGFYLFGTGSRRFPISFATKIICTVFVFPALQQSLGCHSVELANCLYELQFVMYCLQSATQLQALFGSCFMHFQCIFWVFCSQSQCVSHSKQMAQPVVCASKCNPFITFLFKENQAT